MGNNKDKVNVNKECNCYEPGRVNIHAKINGDNRDREWDFLHGCWKERKTEKAGWDLRYN